MGGTRMGLQEGARGIHRTQARFRKLRRTYQFTRIQLVVVQCACAQNPAEFPVKIFFLVSTQFRTKAGRICDEELFCLYPNKKLSVFPLFPALVLANELDISFRTHIKFLSEALVIWQGLIKASFKAV